MIRDIFRNMTVRGKLMLSTAVIFFVLYALSGTSIILVVFNMIESLKEEQDLLLYPYWLLLLGLVLFKGCCNVAADMAKHFAGFDIVEQIREKIIFKLKRFPLSFYTNERLGEISTVIHKDVDNMEAVVAHMWSRMTSDFIVAIILGAGLFYINWVMGLAMISFLPMAILKLSLGIRSCADLQKSNQDDLADMVSLFVEYVKGIPLLKAFSESNSFKDKLKKSIEKFGSSSKTTSGTVAFYLGGYKLFLGLSFAVMVISGWWLMSRGELDLFDFLMFAVISREFYKPFNEIERHWINYIKVRDSYSRIMRIMDSKVVKQPKKPMTAKNFDIEFDDVSFFYEEGEFELKNVSLKLKQGSLNAFVGPSGSGKTTVTNLLLRFWEPQRGTISVGGIPIRDMDYDYLLSKISIVMQNVILFSDSIGNNIKIGDKNATRDQVVAAAKKAMIHDFIMTLPDGYDTLVGENGVGLSGGQKQRISIARAFLKDSPIVVLDEITSNVDPINEAQIQRAITNLTENRTVLVIAHNLSTIRTADQIVVLEMGKIVSSGAHESLLAKCNVYRNLWDAQYEMKDKSFSHGRTPTDLSVVAF